MGFCDDTQGRFPNLLQLGIPGCSHRHTKRCILQISLGTFQYKYLRHLRFGMTALIPINVLGRAVGDRNSEISLGMRTAGQTIRINRVQKSAKHALECLVCCSEVMMLRGRKEEEEG